MNGLLLSLLGRDYDPPTTKWVFENTGPSIYTRKAQASASPPTRQLQTRIAPAQPANGRVEAAAAAAEATERKRQADIMALPAAGLESVLASCVADPSCSVHQATVRLLEAHAEHHRAEQEEINRILAFARR